MIGNLSELKHIPITGLEQLSVGDILGYQVVGAHERFFEIMELRPLNSSNELCLSEFCSSETYTRHPTVAPHSYAGDPFSFDLNGTKRYFTQVLTKPKKVIKQHLCKVVFGALLATDELKNLLIELEI